MSELEQLRRQLAASEAARAVLVEALEVAGLALRENEPLHDEECPEDDTCDCAVAHAVHEALAANAEPSKVLAERDGRVRAEVNAEWNKTTAKMTNTDRWWSVAQLAAHDAEVRAQARREALEEAATEAERAEWSAQGGGWTMVHKGGSRVAAAIRGLATASAPTPCATCGGRRFVRDGWDGSDKCPDCAKVTP